LADENTSAAFRILYSGGSVLACCTSGIVDLADTLAPFVAIPAGVHRYRSSFRPDSGAAVLTRTVARVESFLTKPDF